MFIKIKYLPLLLGVFLLPLTGAKGTTLKINACNNNATGPNDWGVKCAYDEKTRELRKGICDGSHQTINPGCAAICPEKYQDAVLGKFRLPNYSSKDDCPTPRQRR